jgi:predicted DNA binding CopG/RHH family protein
MTAKKKFPSHFSSDEEFEAFFEGDLSPYMEDMLQNAQRITFEFAPKDKQVNLRFPALLLETVKATAKAQGMSYQRYIRKVIEESLSVASKKMAE